MSSAAALKPYLPDAGRILIVDDESPNRRLLRDILEPLGYTLREAEDGEEALLAVRDELPDLVLLDVVMPRRDGYSVCRELKSSPRTRLLPIIILTSLDDLPQKVRAIDLGADDFLNKPFRPAELTARVRSLMSLKRYTDEFENVQRVLEAIAQVVERRDRYTGDHCRRLGDRAVRVGGALGLGPADLKALWLGGVFHDLGKIAVSDSVLNKPAPLSPEEMLVMQTHPDIGAQLCAPMRTMEAIVPLIRHHHEKLDGSGYPYGLKGDEIPPLVRVVTAVDVYDALATERAYRKALPHETCVAIMREEVRKGWWDRGIVETLAATEDPRRAV